MQEAMRCNSAKYIVVTTMWCNVILLVRHIGNKCMSLGSFGHHDTSAISWLNHAYRTRRSLFRKPLLPPTGFAECVCSVIQLRLGKLRGWAGWCWYLVRCNPVSNPMQIECNIMSGAACRCWRNFPNLVADMMMTMRIALVE